MTIERMNELIDKWEGQKKDYDQRMDAKISGMKKDRDLAVAAQTQKIFARHHLSPEELSKLKYASKEQLKRLLKFYRQFQKSKVQKVRVPLNQLCPKCC